MVDTDAELSAFLPELGKATWIAVDTEADSLHAYPEKLCLIQISITGSDRMVDPLAAIDLAPLFEVLRGHELIMHGADYDLRLMRKKCDFVPSAIFDTMLAARLLGCREFGLNNLLSRFLNVSLEKGPQKANWARRPLTPRMEAYARNDTRYLKPLSDILKEQLHEKGRFSWHQESCARLIEDCARIRTADPDTVWRVKGSHRLPQQALAVLREVWHWRESEAVMANKPPYFILTPETMVAVATAAVENASVSAMLPRHLSHRRREGIAEAVNRGLAAEHLPGLIRARSQRQSEAEKRRLRDLEHHRNHVAQELDIDPTLIANRATLVLLAKDWATNESLLMNWQRQLLKVAAVEPA